MTINYTTWPPTAPRLSREVPGSLLGYPPHGKTFYRLAGWLVGWLAGWLPGWLAGPPLPETPKNQFLKPFLEQW